MCGQIYSLNYTGLDINDAIAKMLDLNIGEFNGYMFAGVADPSTVPMDHSYYHIYYLATEAGRYPNFGNIEIDGSNVAMFLSRDDGTWELQILEIPLDVAEVANNAKDIADLALSNTSKVREDVDKALNVASAALEMSTNATALASSAASLASACIKKSDRGIPNGVPILDNTGKVPQSQLPLTKTELVDSYESDSVEMAPTAAALHRLYLYHEDDIVTTKNLLNAVLDLVSDSVELGVSPTTINVTSLAQDVDVQIVCNGAWNILDVPDTITVAPIRGTGNAVIKVSFPENDSTINSKTGSFKVVNSFGAEKSVNFTQYSASTRYVYNLSATPTSVNATAMAGSGSLAITSTRTPYINETPSGQPEPVAYTVTRPNADAWLTIDGDGYSYTENILEAQRSSKIIITQDNLNGKTIEIPVTQAKATVTTEFAFSITPADLGVSGIGDSGAGGTYPAKITSTKTVTVNETVTTTDVPYTVSYTGGASNLWVVYSKENHNIVIPMNTEESARSGAIVFTQESPLADTITVNVTQAQAKVDWKYVFEYSPTTMSFGNAAGSKTYAVTKSTKQKTINGNPTGEEINTAWDVKTDNLPAWLTINNSNNTITAAENTGEVRTADITFLQTTELGDQRTAATMTVTQAAGVVTWEYTLEASANPTSIAALNGSTVLTVTSTKQKYMNGIAEGSPIAVNWHATSTNGYLSGADVSGSTWTMTENTTESTRTDILTIAQLESGGKSKTVNFTQVAATVTWDYAFTVDPTSLSFVNTGEAKSVNVVSTKQKKINGKNSGSPLVVNWSSATSSSGFAVSAASISAAENRTEAARSGTVVFTLAESGKTVNVSTTQAAGTVTWEYSFGVSPTTLSFPNTGNTLVVGVTSSKQKKINGTNEGSPLSVNYTASQSGSAIVSGTSISMAENSTTSARSGTITYTQAESGKTATVSCTQAAGVEGWNYTFSVSPSSMSFAAGGETKSVTITSYKRLTINGKETGVQNNVGYSGTASGTGLTNNYASSLIIFANNTSTSARSGTANYTQNESSKTASVSCTQAGGVITYDYVISSFPSYFYYQGSGGWNSTKADVTCKKRTKVNGAVVGTEDADWGVGLTSGSVPTTSVNVSLKNNNSSTILLIEVNCNFVNNTIFFDPSFIQVDETCSGSFYIISKNDTTKYAQVTISYVL